jgi:hypothetical protein
MKNMIVNSWILSLVAFGLGQVLTLAQTPLSVKIDIEAGQLTVLHEQKPILVYCLTAKPYKPYVRELYTLSGDNILRDAPSDHLHHHALMYAIKVNGVNFWEETAGCGVQHPVRLLPPKTSVTGEGYPQASFTQLIHWITQADRADGDNPHSALIIEKRTLTVTVNKAQQVVSVQWDGNFEVGQKTNHVILSGANYHGLGMRFLSELDPLAKHLLPGQEPDLSNGKQAVVRAPWEMVSFAWPGKPVAIALMGSPANPRGESVFFSMRQPFAYLAATQGLDKETLEYQAGDTFKLSYLVALYSTQRAAEDIQQHYQQWTGTKKN